MNLRFFTVKDSKGRESMTLAFIAFSWALMTVRFIFGGMSVTLAAWRFEVAATSLLDYGAAVAAILSVWLGREWIDGKRKKNEDAEKP